MTNEQLEEVIEKVDIAEINADAAAINLCGVYSKARAVLQLLANLPMLPQKWRAIISALIAVLDGLCPQS